MTVHFAQIREDAAVERCLVARHRPRRIACIGSGGCTALSLLSDEVEVVYAIDANPAQCAVIEVKRAAMAVLDREDWLAFVGEAPASDRAVTFEGLADALPVYARDWWRARPEALALGANHCGSTERFYRFVGGNLRHSVVPDAVWRDLLAADSLDAQRALHARHFTGPEWTTALRVLLSRTTHLAFFPAQMFANVTEHDFAAFFAAQFDREVLTRSIRGNYFLSQLLFGTWLPDSAPPFALPSGWGGARRNLGKLVVRPLTLDAFLASDEARGVEAFFLSNVFDWLDATGRARLCEGLLAAAAPGAVVLWRNMLADHALPASFAERFVPEPDKEALAALDRSMLYRRITAGVLP